MPRNFLDQPDNSWSSLGAILTIGDISLVGNQELPVFRNTHELKAAQTLIGLYRFACDASFGKDNWLTLRIGSLQLAIESIDKLTKTKRQFIKHVYGIEYSPVNFRHAQDLHHLSSSDGSRALTQAFVHYRKYLTDARCRWRHNISGGIHVGNESDLVATGQFCEWECICNFTDKTPLPRDSVMMTLLEQFQESKSHRRWFKGFNGSEFISPFEILYFLNSLVRSAISFMYSHSWGDGLDSRSSSDSGEYTFHRPFTIANVSEGAKLIEQRGMQLRGFNEPLIVNDPVWLENFSNPFITAASTTPNLELTEAEVEGLVQLLTSENLSDDNPFMIPENK